MIEPNESQKCFEKADLNQEDCCVADLRASAENYPRADVRMTRARRTLRGLISVQCPDRRGSAVSRPNGSVGREGDHVLHCRSVQQARPKMSFVYCSPKLSYSINMTLN